MIHQFMASTSDVGVFTAAVRPWIAATCVMTIVVRVLATGTSCSDAISCTNVYGTSVIAWRVWDSNRVLRRTGILEGGRNILVSLSCDQYSTQCLILCSRKAWLSSSRAQHCGRTCHAEFRIMTYPHPFHSTFTRSWVILYLVWYLIGSPLEAIGSGTAPVMIGITFTLITVRIGQGVETRVVEHAFSDAVGLLGD